MSSKKSKSLLLLEKLQLNKIHLVRFFIGGLRIIYSVYTHSISKLL